MSRARGTSHVYAAADDFDQAVDDLTIEWSGDRRQRWVLDVDERATDEKERRPSFARLTDAALRLARLRSERDAIQTVAPQAAVALAKSPTPPRAGSAPSGSRAGIGLGRS